MLQHCPFDMIGFPRILVVGDAMLDRYTWGAAERVSPEAPVIVLNVIEREVRLGGAASVAALLAHLEARVTLATVVGDDHDGRTILRLLEEGKIDASNVLIDPSRPTTVKERFLSRSNQHQAHQLLRVDSECRTAIDHDLVGRLINSLQTLIPQYDAVLIPDYAKGVCTERLIAEVISLCRESCVPVLVDPARGVDFGIYRGASLLKPNRLEAELAIAQPIHSINDGIAAAQALRQRFEFDLVYVTLDADGMVHADDDGTAHHAIVPQAICDITGAGDTVLAVLGLGTACLKRKGVGEWGKQTVEQAGVERRERMNTGDEKGGQTPKARGGQSPIFEDWMPRVAALANVAAGLQVSRPGVALLTRDEIFHEHARVSGLLRPTESGTQRIEQVKVESRKTIEVKKVVTLSEAAELAEVYRSRGQTVVFTNGCFDLLHVGHLSTLHWAAEFGDVLFVAINSDASVQRLKGADRPVISAGDRARMLAAMECVDHVLVFDDATPHSLLNAIRPDVLVKGGTTGHIVGREIVEGYGGRVVRTDECPGQSTTSLLSRIHSNQGSRKAPGDEALLSSFE